MTFPTTHRTCRSIAEPKAWVPCLKTYREGLTVRVTTCVAVDRATIPSPCWVSPTAAHTPPGEQATPFRLALPSAAETASSTTWAQRPSVSSTYMGPVTPALSEQEPTATQLGAN